MALGTCDIMAVRDPSAMEYVPARGELFRELRNPQAEDPRALAPARIAGGSVCRGCAKERR